MRDRVARLRFWLAGSAVLLMVVIVGFIAYGRYVSHLRHLKLPLPPGVNIVREAGGWTYSRANGSKTLYTIHAAGFQQGKNGKTTLRDVSVVLFGKDGDRNDRVYGQNFEYDQKEGVLRAMGAVHIDLQSADAAKAAGHEGQPSTVERGRGEGPLARDVVQVTTSGLVYLEKLGIAATSEDVDVQSGDLKGHARGADYSSDSGMLMLHSAVEMEGRSGGHEVRLNAAQAQFDQRTQQARLTNATYKTDDRSVAADTAVLYRRTDGTLSKVDANGNVTLTGSGGKALARHAEILMDAGGQPASGVLNGNVMYTANDRLRQVRAQAGTAQVSFAGGARKEPDHAVFSGAVRMAERIRTEQGPEKWSSRELTAAKVETWMSGGADGKMLLRNAVATGNARLVATEDAVGLKPSTPVRTEIAGDELKAVMRPLGNRSSLDEVQGKGSTSLLQVTAAGLEQTSMGDTLEASFRPADRHRDKVSAGTQSLSQTAVTLASAVQQGHVTLTRRLPPTPKGAAAEVQRATADKATYDGSSDEMVLSGAVRMNDASGAMWAQQVVLERATGEAHATGPVKVEYMQESRGESSSVEPMHILAERAEVSRRSDSATFYGRPVRVWQGGNQVQAPEVRVERAAKRMIARSGSTGTGSGVRTILVGAGSAPVGTQQPGSPAKTAQCGTVASRGTQTSGNSPSEGGVVKIASGGLVYSGTLSQVNFTGGVRAEMADGMVRATEATAYLAKQSAKSGSLMSLQGGVQRIVAEGQVGLTRPGTRVSGERLLYQAENRTFVLSGGQEPAKAADARGTTTAAAFRFSACDNTLEALGEAPGAPAGKVVTETVPAGARREKAGR